MNDPYRPDIDPPPGVVPASPPALVPQADASADAVRARAPGIGLPTVALVLAGPLLMWAAVLTLHLVSALLAALVTYGGTIKLAARLRRRWPALRASRLLALVLMLVLIGAAIALAIEQALAAARRGTGLDSVLQQMAAALEQLRAALPPWLAQHVPASFDSLRESAAEWLRGHADMVRGWGGGAVRVLGHVIAGVVVGAIAALQLAPRQGVAAAAAAATGPAAARPTLIASLRRRFDELADSFDDVVLAQLTISAINTVLTAVFLLGILPLIGRPLPLAGTVVALTFFVGLLPVVGNLMSNTVIVLVALTQSPLDAAMALAWLVMIHKLEYFLNAQIVGRRIRAQAWELLCAMLLLEAMFGLAGLICAPIAYAQIKQTLHRHGWV